MNPTNYRIVVVDDLEIVLEIIVTQLSERNYHVTPFNDPRAALEFISQNKVHVLFTDLAMPQMTGLELILEIRKRGIIIPDIFVISGTLSLQTRCECLRYGAIALEKPFPASLISDLMAIIRKENYRERKKRNGIVDITVFDPDRSEPISEENLLMELKRILESLNIFLDEAGDVAHRHPHQFHGLSNIREWYASEIERIENSFF